MSASPVADIVRHAIAHSPRSQKQIARAVGFNHPNVLSMIKAGATRVPLERAPALADALGLDRVAFLTACLCEYQPGLFDVLDEVYGLHHSMDERLLLDTLRRQAGHPYLAALSDRSRSLLLDFLQHLRDEPSAAAPH